MRPPTPTELAADGRARRVGVTCQILADGAPSGCHAVSKSGGPAFASATLAWLAHNKVRYRPVILHGHAVAVTRSWTVSLDEPATALADARRKQREVQLALTPPAPPAALPGAQTTLTPQPVAARQVIAPVLAAPSPDRPFSTRVVAGGAPVFPPSYDENRPGAVTVSCVIGADGSASGCQVLRTQGGANFGRSVQTWLASGRVRFRPVTVAGTPVVHRESWRIVFNQMPVEDQ